MPFLDLFRFGKYEAKLWVFHQIFVANIKGCYKCPGYYECSSVYV